MREIEEYSTDWIMREMPCVTHADGDGNISLYADDIVSANLIKGVLEANKTPFEVQCFNDDNNEILLGCVFRIEDIIYCCPTLYEWVKKLNNETLIHQYQLNGKIGDIFEQPNIKRRFYYQTMCRRYTARQVRNLFKEKLSKLDYRNLRSQLCNENIAQYIESLCITDGVLVVTYI